MCLCVYSCAVLVSIADSVASVSTVTAASSMVSCAEQLPVTCV